MAMSFSPLDFLNATLQNQTKYQSSFCSFIKDAWIQEELRHICILAE